MPAGQKSQYHHMDFSKSLEGLSLGAMLIGLPARLHRQRLHVAGDLPKKAAENQHTCLPQVTVPPKGHSLGFGRASL